MSYLSSQLRRFPVSWTLVIYSMLFSANLSSLGSIRLESYSGYGPIAQAPITFYLLVFLTVSIVVTLLCCYGKREMPSQAYGLGLLVLGLTGLLTWNVSLALTGQPYFHDTYRNAFWASLIRDAGSSQGLQTFSRYPVDWPGAWVFGAILQTVTGLDSFQLAISFPFLFSGILMLIFLYLVRTLFATRYERFLSFALLVGVGGAFWESLYSASALSTLLTVAFFATLAGKSTRRKLMSFLFAMAIVVVHPVMPLMLILGLLGYLTFVTVARLLVKKQFKLVSTRLDASVTAVLIMTTFGYFFLGTTYIGLTFLEIVLRLSSYEPPSLLAARSPYTPVDIMIPLSRIVFYSIYGLLLAYFLIFLMRKSKSVEIFRLCVLALSILGGSLFLLPTFFAQGSFGGRAIIIGSLVVPITATAIRFWKNRPGRVLASSLFVLMLAFSILAISSSAPRSVYMETFSSLSFTGSHIHSYGTLMDPSFQAANAMPQGAQGIGYLIDYYDSNLVANGRVDTLVFTRDLLNSYVDFGQSTDAGALVSLANSRYNLVLSSPFVYLYIRPSFQS